MWIYIDYMDQLDEFDLAVAAELRAHKARTGVTLADMSAQTGLSQSTIQRYLKGQREIPLPAFRSIARVVSADPRKILDDVYDAVEDE